MDVGPEPEPADDEGDEGAEGTHAPPEHIVGGQHVGAEEDVDGLVVTYGGFATREDGCRGPNEGVKQPELHPETSDEGAAQGPGGGTAAEHRLPLGRILVSRR